MTAYLIFAVLMAILLGSNALVSYFVGRSVLYSSKQKAVQIALIWVVPVFGALLVGGVLWSNSDKRAHVRQSPDVEVGDVGWSSDPVQLYDHH